jgi:taurine transport system permease protein
MRKVSFIISCATVLAIMVLWFVVTSLEMVSPLFLPPPKRVWEAFIAVCQNGYKSYTFWQHLSSSLKRVSIAFVLAVITAVPLGLGSGYIPWLKAIFEPIVEFVRPLPPLAYYTLLVLWLGIDNESKIMLLYIACFMPIYVACVSAVIRVPQVYIWNAFALGANKRQVFFFFFFPSALPEIFLSMRIALGGGYATLVAAEMVAARSGIGWMVLDASNYLRSDVVFVGIIIMGIVAIALDQIIRAVKRIFVFWEGKDK